MQHLKNLMEESTTLKLRHGKINRFISIGKEQSQKKNDWIKHLIATFCSIKKHESDINIQKNGSQAQC